MLKKIYSFTYECFKGLLLIWITILFFNIWSKEPSNKELFIIAAFFGMFAIASNYEFYKKVHTKQSYIIYKEDVKDWIIRLLVNILYLIALLHVKNTDPFHLFYKIFAILLTINLLLLFSNRFLGTKKENKSLNDLTKIEN
ncbi:hypothetical protein KHQ81_03765 [Mycoplasmatota bacterium]|nr:hypothetical protein KHQ81_03765 [Mycoplasmatota bacterium]